jgi:hypothetical protein
MLEAAGHIAQIVSAIGTLLAVIVALFGAQIRRFIVKPRLDIALSSLGGTTSSVPYFKDENTNCYLKSLWYHLRVTNPNRISPVTAVYVYLLKLETRDASGKFVEVSGLEVPMHWRYAGKSYPPRDFGRPYECDIFRIFEDRHLEVTTIVGTDKIKTMQPPVHIRLSFQASGLEAWSDTITVQVDWDGKWSTDQDEMAKYLVVREVGRTKPD